jgi:drug/metabolite transporter (DMT)-like permease
LALATALAARGGAPQASKLPASRQQAAVFAAAALTITLFALTPITTRVAGMQIPGIDIGLIRVVGSGLFAVPLLVARRLPVPADVGTWALLLVSALGSFAGFPLLFSVGAQLTSASHAGLLMTTMPLMTAALGVAVDRRKPRDVWFFGTGLAFTGELLLLASSRESGNPATLEGDLIVLASCALCACGFVAGGRAAMRLTPLSATLWAITVASVAILPGAVTMAGAVDWSALTAVSWAALFHITAGASVLAYVSWFWALSRGGIARVAPVQLMQPPMVLLFARLCFGDPLPRGLIGAAIVIIGGIALAQRR